MYRTTAVAVKVLKGFSKSHYNDFMNEIKLLGSIRRHNNIVDFLGFCEREGEVLLLTELCEGGNLYSLLRDDKKNLSKKQIFDFLKGIAEGMKHLHREGVIHRDLAARNVLLTSAMEVKVSDFGMSRVIKDSISRARQTDTFGGPLRWMSPESLNNRNYSNKSDVWSYGVVIYEVTTGSIPYDPLSPLEASTAVANDSVELTPSKNFPELKDLMVSCLKFNPDERPSFVQICQYLSAL